MLSQPGPAFSAQKLSWVSLILNDVQAPSWPHLAGCPISVLEPVDFGDGQIVLRLRVHSFRVENQAYLGCTSRWVCPKSIWTLLPAFPAKKQKQTNKTGEIQRGLSVKIRNIDPSQLPLTSLQKRTLPSSENSPCAGMRLLAL